MTGEDRRYDIGVTYPDPGLRFLSAARVFTKNMRDFPPSMRVGVPKRGGETNVDLFEQLLEHEGLNPPRKDARLRRSSFLDGLSASFGHGAPPPPGVVRRTPPGFG